MGSRKRITPKLGNLCRLWSRQPLPSSSSSQSQPRFYSANYLLLHTFRYSEDQGQMATVLLHSERLRPRQIKLRQKIADKVLQEQYCRKEKAMSVAGISSSNLFDFNSQSVQNRKQQFQQLGQDLQSGNLSAAQTDFTTLQPSGPQISSSSTNQNTSPIAQDFKQVSQDIQSGNISAAQQDYAKIQQDFQSQSARKHAHHHHQGGGSGGGSAITQLLQELGQDLQTGNLTAAQQAYGTLQQDFQQSQLNGLFASPTQSSSSGVSVNA
jgi:hypothetical protein